MVQHHPAFLNTTCWICSNTFVDVARDFIFQHPPTLLNTMCCVHLNNLLDVGRVCLVQSSFPRSPENVGRNLLDPFEHQLRRCWTESSFQHPPTLLDATCYFHWTNVLDDVVRVCLVQSSFPRSSTMLNETCWTRLSTGLDDVGQFWIRLDWFELVVQHLSNIFRFD